MQKMWFYGLSWQFDVQRWLDRKAPSLIDRSLFLNSIAQAVYVIGQTPEPEMQMIMTVRHWASLVYNKMKSQCWILLSILKSLFLNNVLMNI